MRWTLLPFLLLELCAIPLAAAQCPQPRAVVPNRFGSIQVEHDIEYVRHGSKTFALDWARPDQSGSFPVVLFVHGGAWWGGSRHEYDDEIREVAHRGFVGVTMDYRVSSDGPNGQVLEPFPAHLEDIRSALLWVQSHATALHARTDRIGLVGGSAGAHLALLVALADQEVPATAQIRAVVNFYGPTDLPRLAEQDPNLGPTIRKVFRDLWAASPVAYLSSSSPPILTLHGTDDDTVSILQAEELDSWARQAGASHQLIRCEGEGHGFSRENRRIALEQAYLFLDQQLTPKRNALRSWHRRCLLQGKAKGVIL